MTSDASYDLVVVGGGTAGLVTAAGAAALGATVALVERGALGGDCLWAGCVPSKALIAFARRRKEGSTGSWTDAAAWMRAARERVARHDSPERFRGMGVDVVFGPARLTSPGRVNVDGRVLKTRRLVLATGAIPSVPPIAGLEEAGYLTYQSALEQATSPESLLVLGGGPIGLEYAQTYARLGTRVTVLELLPEVLPREDPAVGRFIRERLQAEGVVVRTGVQVARVCREGTVKAVYGADGERFTAAEIFVAAGRRPEVGGIEPGRAGVELDRGAVRVNRRLETTQRGIWAAGDVTGGLQFTHVADYMARIVVQNALTPLKAAADYRVVPWVTFTDPEVARVGLTLEEARAAGERCEEYGYDFVDLDRAIVDGSDSGFCKVVTRPNGRMLGATIVGRSAGELIMIVALAMRHGVPLPRLARAVFPYPTMSEILRRTADGWYRAKFGATWRGRWLRRVLRWWR